jgi:hypothetical protein
MSAKRSRRSSAEGASPAMSCPFPLPQRTSTERVTGDNKSPKRRPVVETKNKYPVYAILQQLQHYSPSAYLFPPPARHSSTARPQTLLHFSRHFLPVKKQLEQLRRSLRTPGAHHRFHTWQVHWMTQGVLNTHKQRVDSGSEVSLQGEAMTVLPYSQETQSQGIVTTSGGGGETKATG